MSSRINVTKTFLPDINLYKDYLDKLWNSGQLTNQGQFLQELELRLKKYLNVTNFHFVSNGTIAIQLALHSLGITKGDVITTPFSYVATISSILWERCHPIFVDIDPYTFCIDPEKIEEAITEDTRAILGVHVFGYPCDIEKIEKIADRYGLKVIYDAAHAFGAVYKGRSLLDYGDISTCSFHATKVFHSGEGGGIVVKDNDVSNKLELVKRFGHEGDDHYCLGINAKASELHAIMGLCNLMCFENIVASRKNTVEYYDSMFKEQFQRPVVPLDFDYNYAYYPILLEDEKACMETINKLNKKNIFPRRYFYPSLNKLRYLDKYEACPVAEDIASRVLCLPLYAGMDYALVEKITSIIKS